MLNLNSKKYSFVSLLILILIASFFLFYNLHKYPLTNYDEATYAKVVMDTIKSDSISTLKFYDKDWFEKPPLYFWLAINSVKTFGANEFAFRFPSVIFALLCLIFTWLIVKKLTSNNIVAALSFLILLFSPPFFGLSREMRLESGVLAFMLLTLYGVILGWQKNKYLLSVFPALALGFMVKSFIVILIVPIIIIYSFFYKHWSWLKSKYLWWGALLALIIIIPWHLMETLQFGSRFWDIYFLTHVFIRVFYGITENVTTPYFSYFELLWQYYQSWVILIFILTILLIIFVSKRKIKKKHFKSIIVPALSALFLLIFFSLVKTHISAYIYPLFPFAAMFIAISSYHLWLIFKTNKSNLLLNFFSILIITVLLNVGCLQSIKIIDELIMPYQYEQKELALIFREHYNNQAPLYLLDWPCPEAITYYSNSRIQNLSFTGHQGEILKAPYYLVTNTLATKYLLDDQGKYLTDYQGIETLYQGSFLVLIYSIKDTTMPTIK